MNNLPLHTHRKFLLGLSLALLVLLACNAPAALTLTPAQLPARPTESAGPPADPSDPAPPPTGESTSPPQPGAQPTSPPEPAVQPTLPAEPGPTEPPPPATATNPPPPTPTPTPLPLPPARPVAGIENDASHNAQRMESMVQAGTAWVRRNALLWSVVESQEGSYNWNALASLEKEMRDAASQGLEMILIVRGTPAWAQNPPGRHCGAIRADKFEAFARFMNAAVARYSVPPFNVSYWELYNEPDVSWNLVPGDSMFGCWGDQALPYFGGSYYGEMLQTVYPQVKAANPEAQLLVGGLLLDCDPNNPPETSPGSGSFKDCSPATFLQGILESGAGDSFDGISFHAYDYYYGENGAYGNTNWHSQWDSTGPLLIPKTRYLRELLSSYGYEDKYLINSEVALLCGSSGNEPPCQTADFQNTKAYYLAQSYAAALAAGLRANIWYSLTGWRASGLVQSNLGPNPAYQAFRFSAAQLAGAAYYGEISTYPGVRGYHFNRDGRTVWILWSRDGASHLVELPSAPAAVFDVYGQPLAASQSLDVSLTPIYIEWSP